MLFTTSTLITTTILCSILIIIIAGIVHIKPVYLKKVVKIASYFVVLTIVRLSLPIELPYSKALPNTNFMPVINGFFHTKIYYTHTVWDLLCVIWLSVAIIIAGYKMNKYYNFYKIIKYMPPIHKYDKVLEEIVDSYNWKKYYQKIKIISIPNLASPIIVGLFHPIIILPEINLDDKDAYYIILHELHHFRQKDLFLKAFCEILKTIYWWNPIILLLFRQVNILSEINTDLQVVKNLDDFQCTDYLSCLLKVSRSQLNNKDRVFSLSFCTKNPESLKNRVNVILDFHQNKSSNKRNIIPIIICFGFLLLSYSFTIESYITDSEMLEGSIPIDPKTFHILVKDDKYLLYIDNEYVSTFTTKNLEGFEDVPIIYCEDN